MYLLKIYYEKLHQGFRNILYDFKNKNFPFGLNKVGSKEQYLYLYEEAKKTKYDNIDSFERKIGFKIDNNWINDLALHTQVVIKKSKICYVHGRI